VKIRGKTVLLTGATGGLGRAIAAALANGGARLVLSSRTADELAELAASLPGEHRVAVADLALEGSAERLCAEAPGVDVLVANAGLPGSGRLEKFTSDELTRALRVNLEAPIKMARELGPAMRERGGGHLVFISSLAGKAASPRSSVYSATKFGLRGFALSLREDFHGTGVGVSLVMPGFIRDAGMFADSKATAPFVGTATPNDVGKAVVRAIERDRGVVEVAPRRQRIAAGIAHRHPQLAARLVRRRAGNVADQVAEGQTDKR